MEPGDRSPAPWLFSFMYTGAAFELLPILKRLDLGPQIIDRLLLILDRLNEDRDQLDIVNPLVRERFPQRRFVPAE
jgi:hypothetical protein